MGRRAAKLVVLAGLVGLLGACAGIKPVTSAPASTGPQEMDPNQGGVLSGDQGSITLFERK
ncbi:MAG: hypothetical protein WDN69_34955 [Aliidongia sp.]